ncbi:hypothetical protein GDO81_000025 [Engystomops pustulosus]|uniref:Uncharacterized protein n=1 Tax=Engystomops pustulosus TaxID=76066 RepID=A0AAV7D115_ENGPU|nr:hypothetical protein GDO81_000025 [Engystomops pustulosus]
MQSCGPEHLCNRDHSAPRYLGITCRIIGAACDARTEITAPGTQAYSFILKEGVTFCKWGTAGAVSSSFPTPCASSGAGKHFSLQVLI